MSEIEVGEFVRTKDDGIVKLLEKEIDGSGLWCGDVDKAFWLRENNIIKHSKDIIDLIEVGDYVNGAYVHTVDYKRKIVSINAMLEEGYAGNVDLNETLIKSILTHEQYVKNAYEVEG